MNDPEYRNAEPEDLPVIVEIYNSTVAGRMVTADTIPVTVESKREWFNKHNAERPVKIITSGTEVIGWISFNEFYGRPGYASTAEISIYLHQQYRNKGLGDKILKDCISWCPQLNIKKLLGFIFAHNLPSIRLFLNNGFEEWGHLPDVAIMDGKNYSLKIFGLSIP